MKSLAQLFKGSSAIGRVAFNMKPMKGPWGGSSPFVAQMESYLKWRRFDVRYDLSKETDVIVLIDPREGSNKPFGVEEIAEYKREHPKARVIHRVNECDQRKDTAFMDDLLEEANGVADYTVFISKWVEEYHAKKWFDIARPHKSVYNGADPRIFHPLGGTKYSGLAPFRIVTHHWSPHLLKGFDVYEEVDSLIADGNLEGIELWVIGRWPDNIQWRSAKTFAPLNGASLAAKLKMCHAYITASLWEPCGMHHVEGAQCGLPIIYHEDGGGIVEACEKYGIGFKDNVGDAILKMRDEYRQMRNLVIGKMPCGERMCLDYMEIIQSLMSDYNMPTDAMQSRIDG